MKVLVICLLCQLALFSCNPIDRTPHISVQLYRDQNKYDCRSFIPFISTNNAFKAISFKSSDTATCYWSSNNLEEKTTIIGLIIINNVGLADTMEFESILPESNYQTIMEMWLSNKRPTIQADIDTAIGIGGLLGNGEDSLYVNHVNKVSNQL